MVDIQDTSLYFFVYSCIVQASSVSCINNHVFMVSFLSEMNYFPTLVGLFFNGKNKPINRTEQFISPIKSLRANIFFNVLSMFQINKFWFFCQKSYYITLTNTCVNKDFWKNRVAFEVPLKVNRWALKFPWMKRSQIFFF